jgi:hypothetical protein
VPPRRAPAQSRDAPTPARPHSLSRTRRGARPAGPGRRLGLARPRRGDHAVPERSRPIRGRTAPRHRHRGSGRNAGRGCRGGRGALRGHRRHVRSDGERAHRRRLRHLVPAPVVRCGSRRRARVGGRASRSVRDHGRALRGRSAPPLRSARGRHPPRLRRPPVAVAAGSGAPARGGAAPSARTGPSAGCTNAGTGTPTGARPGCRTPARARAGRSTSQRADAGRSTAPRAAARRGTATSTRAGPSAASGARAERRTATRICTESGTPAGCSSSPTCTRGGSGFRVATVARSFSAPRIPTRNGECARRARLRVGARLRGPPAGRGHPRPDGRRPQGHGPRPLEDRRGARRAAPTARPALIRAGEEGQHVGSPMRDQCVELPRRRSCVAARRALERPLADGRSRPPISRG